MRLVTQRALDRGVGAVLCRLLSLFPWRYKEVPPRFLSRQILVILLSEMGSLVLSKPMFDLLREEHPGAVVHLLLFERNRGVLEVVDLVPDKEVLSIDDRSLRRFVVSTLRALYRLRRMKVDTVIDGELFSRVSSLFSLLSGAKVRAGFERHTQEGLYRGGFINRPALYNPYIHFCLQLMAMAQSIRLRGRPLMKKSLRRPSIDFGSNLPAAEESRFHDRLETDFPSIGSRDLVLVYPGGGLLPIRAWPLGHYCALVNSLLQQGYAVAVIGTAEDKILAEELLLSCRGGVCLDFTGYTRSVKELLFLLRRAVLLIGNDGGPAHFASLASTPTIVLFGPETPTLYGPLGTHVYAFHTPLACSPCLTAYNHRRSPCDGDNQCLKLISPESVFKKGLEMIAASRHRARTR
jgi:ADP-heptose:LPS heptosyltransferase